MFLKCLKYYLIASSSVVGSVGGIMSMMYTSDNPKSKFRHHLAGFALGATIGSISGPIVIPYIICNHFYNKNKKL